MKKSLVMAMAMAMGVTASAYAANPFSDVPAGHWAYDAVAGLAAAGVVDGYGTTFGGDKLMTRYEMAQIVAKAMAKGGNCDKLAAEFAEELDALGVRVAKLEKKVDNVKVTGNIRYSYADGSGDEKLGGRGVGYNRFRTRLFVNGAINDDWSYTGMLENNRFFTSDNNAKNDNVALKRAWLNGRLGGVKLRAGRVYFVQNDMFDAEADGVEVKYSIGKVNLTGWMMRNANVAWGAGESAGTDPEDAKWVPGLNLKKDDTERVYMAKVDTKFGKLGAAVQYWAVDGSLTGDKHYAQGFKTNIWELGLDYSFDKDWNLAGQFYRGSIDNADDYSKNGYEVSLKYKGAKAAKPGSWGAWLTYDYRPVSTFIRPTSWGTYAYSNSYWTNPWTNDGYKGIEVGVNYAFAKNIVGTVRYFDLEGRDNRDAGNGSNKVRTWWGDVTFTF